MSKHLKVLVPLAATVLAAVALLLAPVSTAAAAKGQAGVRQLPADCIANIYAGVDTLNVGILVPGFPEFWDVSPPVGAWAGAHGRAIFTPGGGVTVVCNADPYQYNDGETAWPSGTFVRTAPAFTALGGDDFGHGTAVYNGRATVITTANGRVTIVAHLKYDHTAP